MPNRVVLGREVKAGDKFQLAVFAVNGPLSAPNGSIWFRSAAVVPTMRSLRLCQRERRSARAARERLSFCNAPSLGRSSVLALALTRRAAVACA